MRAFPIALLGLVIGSAGRAQQRPRLPLDLSRLVARRDSFAVLVQGNQIGFLRSVLERGAEGFTYTETSSIGGLVDQTTTVVLDPSGAMKSVRQAGTVQGQPASIELDYGDGRVRGKASTVGADGAKSVSIDTTVAPGTVAANVIPGILPAWSLAPDQSWKSGSSSERRANTGSRPSKWPAPTGPPSEPTP
jgi:hypothetical protein